MSHLPVLKNEILHYLEGHKITVFFDGTLGAGGHADTILSHHPEIKLYIGCDQDPEGLKIAKKTLSHWKSKVRFVHSNFSQIDRILQEEKVSGVDGFLIDVGVSSMQLASDRGFSFQKDNPLDMRMDPQGPMSAEIVVNSFSQKELEKIFQEFGEERNYRKIAQAIIHTRKKKRISSTKELADLIATINRRGKIHPATRVFQALRIFVNQELTVLQQGLEKAIHFMNLEAIAGCISFHSLEDRIVKNIFRDKKKEGILELLSKKPIVPTLQERRENRRSRSAKLRIAKKVAI